MDLVLAVALGLTTVVLAAVHARALTQHGAERAAWADERASLVAAALASHGEPVAATFMRRPGPAAPVDPDDTAGWAVGE